MGQLRLQLKLLLILRLHLHVKYFRIPQETWGELRRKLFPLPKLRMIIALRQRHRFSFLGKFGRRGSWLLHLIRNTGLRQVGPGRIGHDPSNLLPSAVFEFREHILEGSARSFVVWLYGVRLALRPCQ